MRTLIGLGILVVLLVTAILSLPFLIDLNKDQDQYKPLIEEALNRKVVLSDPARGTGDTDNMYLWTLGYSFDTTRKR